VLFGGDLSLSMYRLPCDHSLIAAKSQAIGLRGPLLSHSLQPCYLSCTFACLVYKWYTYSELISRGAKDWDMMTETRARYRLPMACIDDSKMLRAGNLKWCCV